MTVPATSRTEIPDLPPLRCRDFTSWPLGGGRFVGAYLADDGNWEVLHVGGGGFEKSHGVHVFREAAEVEAAALAVLLTAQVTA